MGCDIHVFVERKGEEKWEPEMVYDHTGRPQDYYTRSYDLFAILADVRNYQENQTPICESRDVPVDCSEQYRKLVEEWGSDGHSHSFFTLDELISAAPRYRDIVQSGYITADAAEDFDKNGTLPDSWWKGGNIPGQQWRTWTRHYDKGPVDNFCDHIIRIIQVLHPYYDKDKIIKDAANYRVCFFFDN